MRRSLLSLALAASLASVAAMPALDEAPSAPADDACRLVDIAETPDTADDDVTICEQQLFVRAGDAPISNLASAVFSTEAPSGAPVGGAGFGGSGTDVALQGDPAHGLEVSGSFTGAVDSFELEVYMLSGDMGAGNHGETPQVEIDGFNFGGALIDMEMESGPNGTGILRLGFDDMLSLWDLLNFSYDADAEHTLRVNLSPYYVGNDGLYLYDGTDVPSNVILNQG